MTRIQELFIIVFGIFIFLIYLSQRQKSSSQISPKQKNEKSSEKRQVQINPSIVPVKLNDETNIFINLRARDIPGFWNLDYLEP